ncbi:elongation factor 1-beta-like [Daphnia pulicaria]|uniref:elongation factor 1-beta-like n=1 Tax=Daphnia pulicaria TaxID=35523 RepID=UPI001EEB129E|nr:elongation factor 1-beta-like [Daphnia pulicaria]
MAFGDLKTENGVKALNEFLADRSYIEGYEPSQADVTTFQALGKAPASSFPHALRWYNHIKSFGSETSKFPGAKSAAAAPASKPADDDDDDVDLFGSDDEEDEAAEKIKADRIKAYSEKKSKKPALIPKSSIVLDVKPWDDETDMEAMEKAVKTITCDGLIWGQCKFVPLAYGIKKLQIGCVIEDDKVSVDWLTEEIQNFEDLVQSVDIAAFNKI